MKFHHAFAFTLPLILILACNPKKKVEEVPVKEVTFTLTAPEMELTLPQNGSASVDLGGGTNAYTVLLAEEASQGSVSINGSIATYRSTNPLFSGVDSFKYKWKLGSLESQAAPVKVNVTALAAGNHGLTENYTGNAYVLSGWKNYSSSYGHTANSKTEFVGSKRHYAIYGDVNSYAGDASYQAKFGALPIDGAQGAMRDWPWKAEMIYRGECGYDATVTMKLAAHLNQHPMGAILLNYDINGTGSQQTLNGYQILFNSGGGSLTLSRFINANELATAFIDRWPNTSYGSESMQNPVSYGPYKGWNYQRSNWPAGGNVSPGTSLYLAARYQYDVNTKTTTISYEARNTSGVDMTPGTWDRVVVLTGNDSLPTGGHFGFMGLNYHSNSELISTDFSVSEFKLECSLP